MELGGPKSPREYLYGKRCHLAKLNLLDKQITSLQHELNHLHSLQPSSRCCQEVNEFVSSREDPLIAMDRNPLTSEDCCWTILSWGKSCLRPKWNWCCFHRRHSTNSGTVSTTQHHKHHQQGKGKGCCFRTTGCLRCARGKQQPRCTTTGATPVSCSQQKGCCCGQNLCCLGCSNGGANCWPHPTSCCSCFCCQQ